MSQQHPNHPNHPQSGYHPHQYPAYPTQPIPPPLAPAPVSPAPAAAAPGLTRSNPGAAASTSGVILHQPYQNFVGIHPAQTPYAQHPIPSSSSAVPQHPSIPTHTRPVDIPPSPARPGSTHYGSDPFSLSQYSLQRSITPGPYMHPAHPLQPGSPSAPSHPNYLDLPKSPPKENKCQYPNCDASFDRRYDLKRHILSRHQDPDFQCPFCLKKLSRSDALTRHFGTCSHRAAVLAAHHPGGPRPTQ